MKEATIPAMSEAGMELLKKIAADDKLTTQLEMLLKAKAAEHNTEIARNLAISVDKEGNFIKIFLKGVDKPEK